MSRILLSLILLSLVACESGRKEAKAPDSREVELGRLTQLYEVVQEKAPRGRVGFVEKWTYDSGRVIYWVTTTDRSDRRGWLNSAGRAYRYEWITKGHRSENWTDLGVDTFNEGVRNILRYDGRIELEPITPKQLADELLREMKGGSSGGEDPPQE